MMDLKEMYQERAEEISMEKYDCEFYDLSQERQLDVYLQAERGVVDEVVDHADNLRKSQKEGNQ